MSDLPMPRPKAPVSRLRAFSRRLIDVTAVLILLVALAMIVPGFFGIQRYVITGGSMSGTFEVGAVVFEQAVPVEDLQVGDIITYRPPADSLGEQLVTHRITSIESSPEQGQVFTTKGDANTADDPWKFRIDTETQPKLLLAVNYLGWPMIWLSQPLGRIVLIGVPAAMICLFAIREVITVLREPSKKSVPADQA